MNDGFIRKKIGHIWGPASGILGLVEGQTTLYSRHSIT